MRNNKLLLRGRVLYPHGISEGSELVEIDNGIISSTGAEGTYFPGIDHYIYDFGPNYICPGFIDLHVHGCGGADVMDADRGALERMSLALAEGGTTSFLATTMSASREALSGAVKNLTAVGARGVGGAQVIGIHLEGPFLNPIKKGAHSEKYLRLPDVDELKEYIDAGRGMLRMITLAPELPGAAKVIECAKSVGMTVSLGHSNATITQVEEASGAGLTHVTHAFNAMAGFHHRDPGTTGAILSMKQLTVDVITDGIHVHPSVVKILVHSKKLHRVCAITDCIRAGRMGDGVFELGGQKVTVKNGVSYLEDGTISGSTMSMAQAIQNMVEKVGLTLPEAVQMVTANPAGVLGISDRGVIEAGKKADIVVLDHKFNVLMTIIGGQVVCKN